MDTVSTDGERLPRSILRIVAAVTAVAAVAVLAAGIALRRHAIARYWAWKVSSCAASREMEATSAALALVRIGPEAEAAVTTLVRSDSATIRYCAVAGMYLDLATSDGEPQSKWWIPFAVHAATDGDVLVSEKALAVVEELSGQRFLAPGNDRWQENPDELRRERVRAMLKWWETTGKTRYIQTKLPAPRE